MCRGEWRLQCKEVVSHGMLMATILTTEESSISSSVQERNGPMNAGSVCS